ncbi:hypothetical protein [Nocardia stercoris]|uniref:Mce protein n=1 Tax=Nocardia stercoris TaxID=2483361 RepID=A0A3M2KRY8_9NOCA|nr:hypothetical protein [Nocardia stercoris]RMI28239.1 hypothetical protein EBN03_30780 [Nocardia stercoris]
MNDTTTTNGRSRRRASREAGSPVADTPSDATVVVTAAGDAGTQPASPTVKLDIDAALAEDSAKSESAAAPAKQAPAEESVKTEAAEPVDTVADADEAAASASASETVKSASATGKTAEAAPADDDVTVSVVVPEPAAAPASTSMSTTKTRRGLGWGEIAAVVAIVLGLVGLTVSGGYYLHMRSDDAARTSRDQTYVQTARQAVLNLTNISDDTAPADIDRVLAIASGQLKEEYSQRKDAYAKVVQDAKVKATGEVIEAAIESEDDSSARILVAAKQTLTNASDPKPQERYYRFRVTVNRGDSGTTASQVEFVA